MSLHVLHDDPWGVPESEAARRFRQSLAMLLGAALLFAFGIVLLAAANVAPAARRLAAFEQAPPPPPPAWVDIVKPLPLFDLLAPELAKSPLVYTARRLTQGGGRQDSLTFGTLASPAYLRLTLYRVGAETAPVLPLGAALNTAATQAGLSLVAIGLPSEMATRFGPMQIAELRLADADAPGSATGVPCLGFRGLALSGGFRMSGFACGSESLPMARPTLACLIDRLDLNAAGDDQALSGFFAATELNRNPACAGTDLRPTAAHANWLDRNDAPPPLQGKKLL